MTAGKTLNNSTLPPKSSKSGFLVGILFKRPDNNWHWSSVDEPELDDIITRKRLTDIDINILEKLLSGGADSNSDFEKIIDFYSRSKLDKINSKFSKKYLNSPELQPMSLGEIRSIVRAVGF